MSKTELKTILKIINSVGDNVGIYPAAVEALNKEDSYKERDGFKNGWNACVREYISKVQSKIHEFESNENLFSNAEEIFSLIGDSIFEYDNDTWYIFLNDTWYYACADGEDIPKEKYNEVLKWLREYGYAGVLYWVYLQRGHLPEISDSRIKVLAVQNILKEVDVEEAKQWIYRFFYSLNKQNKSAHQIATECLDKYNDKFGPCPLTWYEIITSVKRWTGSWWKRFKFRGLRGFD